MARPMPLFAPVTTAIREKDILGNRMLRVAAENPLVPSRTGAASSCLNR